MSRQEDHHIQFPQGLLSGGLHRTPGRPSRKYDEDFSTPMKHIATSPAFETSTDQCLEGQDGETDKEIAWDDDIDEEYLASLSILNTSSTNTFGDSTASPVSLSDRSTIGLDESVYIRQSLLSLDPKPSRAVRTLPAPSSTPIDLETPGIKYRDGLHQTDKRCTIKIDPRYAQVHRPVRDLPKFFDEQVRVSSHATLFCLVAPLTAIVP